MMPQIAALPPMPFGLRGQHVQLVRLVRHSARNHLLGGLESQSVELSIEPLTVGMTALSVARDQLVTSAAIPGTGGMGSQSVVPRREPGPMVQRVQ